jgi:hypothetical protein
VLPAEGVDQQVQFQPVAQADAELRRQQVERMNVDALERLRLHVRVIDQAGLDLDVSRLDDIGRVGAARPVGLHWPELIRRHRVKQVVVGCPNSAGRGGHT